LRYYTDHIEQKTSVIGLITAWEKLNRNDLAMTLSPAELAAFWHLPHTEFSAPEIQWLEGAKAPAEITRNTAGVLIGDNSYAGVKTPIYLDDKDRTTGMYVLGKPGMGKARSSIASFTRIFNVGSALPSLTRTGSWSMTFWARAFRKAVRMTWW